MRSLSDCLSSKYTESEGEIDHTVSQILRADDEVDFNNNALQQLDTVSSTSDRKLPFILAKDNIFAASTMWSW